MKWTPLFIALDRIILEGLWGETLIDLSKVGKMILEGSSKSSEVQKSDAEDDGQSIPLSFNADMDSLVKKSGTIKELDNFPTAVSGSLGIGIIAALIYDSVRNRGDEGLPIFLEPWRTMMVATGSSLLGFSMGKINRGITSQREAEYYQKVIKDAEDSTNEKEAEEEKQKREAEDRKSETLSTLGLGEFGMAVGQNTSMDYPTRIGW